MKYKGFPARVGYHLRGENSSSSYEEPSSGHYSTRPDQPNVYRLHERTVQDHGRHGQVLYRLDDNEQNENETYVNSRRICQTWYEVSSF